MPNKTQNNKGGALAFMADASHQVLLGAVRHTLMQGQVVIDAERCKGCELCVYECPAHTLSLSDSVNMRGFHHSQQIAPHKCIGCASCALVCPDACITVFRHSRIPRPSLQSDAQWSLSALMDSDASR